MKPSRSRKIFRTVTSVPLAVIMMLRLGIPGIWEILEDWVCAKYIAFWHTR